MNILELPDASLCVRLAATMGHFLWQGAAVYLLVIFAGLLLRRSSAGARYAVFTAALLVMAACPPVTFVLLRSPEMPPVVSGGHSPPYVRPEVETHSAFLGGQSPPYELPAAPTAAEPVSLAMPDEPAVEAIDWWRYAPWLVACYLGGTTLMFARLLVALCGGQRLRRRSEPVDDPAILAAFVRQARALGVRFAPAIAFCREVAVPTVVGVLRPMILLPLSAASGLTTEQIEVLLAHELAHIRRYDHLVNILQRLIEAALFFHPAVWFISRRIRIEREHCCDDLVLAVGGKRLAYAESLVRMAELSRGIGQSLPYGATVAALGAADRPSQLRLRILRLVSGNTSEQVRLLRPTVLGLCLFLMLAAVACVQLASRPTEDRPIEAVPPGMVGTWFFENPMGDDEQMAVLPDGRVVVLYSNGHRDEARYTDGTIELAEYGNLKAKLTLLPDGRTLQTSTAHSGIAKLWQRIDAAPKTELLRPLTEPPTEPAATQPTTQPADALAWGEVVDGLQAAVELVPGKEAYAYGEKIDVRFHVRNVSDGTIQLATATLRQDRAEVRDDGGTIRDVPAKWYSGWAIIVRHELEPGQEVTLESTGLGIVQESQELESPWRQTGVILRGEPGRYAIRYVLPFPDVRREHPDGTVSVPQPTDWQGTLNTGWRELTVKLPDDVAERRAAAAEAVRLPDDLTWAFDPTPGLEIGVHESRLRFRLGTKTLDLDVVDGKVRAAWSDGAKQNEVVGKVVRIDRPAPGDSGPSTGEPVLIDVVDGKPLTNDAASPLLDAARPSFVKGKLRFRGWGSESHLIDTHDGKLRIWEPDGRRMIESQGLRYGGSPPAPSTAPAARPDTRPSESADGTVWGEAAEKVQCSLRAERTVWRTNEVPELLARVRHDRPHQMSIVPGAGIHAAEIDGRWYFWRGYTGGAMIPLPPRTESADIRCRLGQGWCRVGDDRGRVPLFSGFIDFSNEELLRLEPGRHTIRVATVATPPTVNEGYDVTVVSNPVEIEILPASSKDATTQPVPGSDLSAKHTIGSSDTAPRTREQEFEERARALRAEVEAETPEETVRNLSYKTYEIISSTRSLTRSLFATHGEEAIDDINKDPRVQKLLRLIHEGDDAQRRALRDVVLKMVNIYLTELPDSTPANAAWRPSVMHPGGGIAYAYLLTQLDVDPVSTLKLLVDMHLRDQRGYVRYLSNRSVPRPSDVPKVGVITDHGTVIAFAAEQLLTTLLSRGDLQKQLTQPQLDALHRFERRPEKGWRASERQLPILKYATELVYPDGRPDPGTSASQPAATQPAKDKLTVRLFPLKNARASEIAQTVRKVLGGEVDKLRFVDDQMHGNLLTLMAAEEDLNRIAHLVAQLDKPKRIRAARMPDKMDSVAKVVRPKQAKASDVADTIASLYPPSSSANLRDVVVATADEKRGMVMITCDPSMEEEIDALVAQVDTAEPADDFIKVFHFPHADIDELGKLLREWIGPATRRIRIRLTVDHPTSSLIVEADKDELLAIAKLLVRLNQGLAGSEWMSKLPTSSRPATNQAVDGKRTPLDQRLGGRQRQPLAFWYFASDCAAARQALGEDCVPELIAMFSDQARAIDWEATAAVIGYVSRDKRSVHALYEYASRKDDLTDVPEDWRSRLLWGKVNAFRWMGLIDAEEATPILRDAASVEGAGRVVSRWVDDPLLPDKWGQRAIGRVQNAAVMGLIYTQQADNVEYVRRLYERVDAEVRRVARGTLFYDGLVDAMAVQSLIQEIGLEGYLRAQSSNEDSELLSPHIEKYMMPVGFRPNRDSVTASQPAVSTVPASRTGGDLDLEELEELLKRGPLSYEEARRMIRPDQAHELYPMLERLTFWEKGRNLSRVIGYVTKDEQAVRELLAYAKKTGGQYAFESIGLIGGSLADKILRLAFNGKATAEMSRGWSEEESELLSGWTIPDYLARDVKSAAATGLVLTRKPENIALVKAAYEENRVYPKDWKKMGLYPRDMNLMTEAMVVNEVIEEKGMEYYLKLSTLDSATHRLSMLSPYFDKYRSMPPEEQEASAPASDSRSATRPAPPDVADVPVQDLNAGGNEKMRYFLIGPRPDERVPAAGYKLVVVLPGGNGGVDFHPFVCRLFKFGIPAGYVVAQPVAFAWAPDQQIVWPTRMNKVPGQQFATEDFVEAVIKDVRSKHELDNRHIYTLSWSSGGPAAYAVSLAENSPVTGSFVAMSVFKPDQLPSLDRAKGHAYYLYHSPNDRVCPYRMAEEAESMLNEKAAAVTLKTYQGRHGWQGGAVYGAVRDGIKWLERQHGDQAPSAAGGRRTLFSQPSP